MAKTGLENAVAERINDCAAAYNGDPLFVVPHALGLCPICNREIVEGPAGGVICDECGWHYRPSSDIKVSPGYGAIGGPMGACDK